MIYIIIQFIDILKVRSEHYNRLLVRNYGPMILWNEGKSCCYSIYAEPESLRGGPEALQKVGLNLQDDGAAGTRPGNGNPLP